MKDLKLYDPAIYGDDEPCEDGRYVKLSDYKSLQSKIEQLEQRDKWISVDERLPELMIDSYIFTDYSKQTVAYIDEHERWLDSMHPEHSYTDSVTHWKPITAPDSKPKLLDHHTSEDCWCEPEEVSEGVFVHKDRH